MKAPPGLAVPPGTVLLLHKGIYGLKQAGRLWYLKLQSVLLHKGFTQSNADPCVFFQHYSPSSVIYMAVYVDDLCLFGTDDANRRSIDQLRQSFKLRDIGNMDFLLGLQLHSTSTGVLVHQTKFIQSVLARFQQYLGFPASTPLSSKPLHPRYESNSPDYHPQLDLPFDKKLYMEVLGSLNYASTYTRIDITTAVSFLSQFNNDPAVKHWQAVVRILNYLQSCPDLGIYYDNRYNSNLISYSDASYNIHHTSKSQLGYVITLAGGPIHWKSTKTQVTCLSSTEAEYMAISNLGRELQSYVNLYTALNLPLRTPILIYEDNLSTIAMCLSDSYTARSKHIAVRYHHIRDLVQSGIIKIDHIRTNDQPADLLTKGLDRHKFTKFRLLLSLQLWSFIKSGKDAWIKDIKV